MKKEIVFIDEDTLTEEELLAYEEAYERDQEELDRMEEETENEQTKE